ncbi:uncharacterized mitochondrial protein-like protein, partial [Tanacetum coccineum]
MGDHQKLQLNELNELRDQAYENSLIYKEKTKKLHDSKIKNRIFNVGDQVLFFNSRLKIFSGKLKTRWSRPFTIAQVFPYGTVKLSQPDGPNFKVNGHRVKYYFGGDIPPKFGEVSRYGYIKNHKKTIKNKQAQTRERKSEQKPEAKPGKVKPSVKVVKSWCDNGAEFKNKEMNQFCERKDHLGKFDGKADEGFFIGYSINNKAFRVFNSRIRIVEENLHVQFSENTPNITGSGPNWLFDIDALTKSMNYKPFVAGNQSNGNEGTKAYDNARDDEKKVTKELGKEGGDSSKDGESYDQEKEDNVNNTNIVNAASINEVNVVGENTSIKLLDDPNMPELEDIVYLDDNKDVDMDVKMLFINGKIEEKSCCQPTQESKIPNFPDRVYKVKKALYGLHQAPRAWYETLPQAPRAWYETLSTYLLDNRFQRGKIDKTLFIRRDKGDILLVQVYVDDIIFGSTKKSLCTEFEKMMHKKFQMSSMGELTFFLGLQVKQKEDGIFISQDKYVTEILKKFGFTDVKTASTPMETQKPLLKDEDGEEVDVHLYRSMIGSLMYLTSSRPDIMFAVCACARYQVNPKVSHLHAVKRIFRYLKGQPKLGLWYPKDLPFDLVAYTDSDYAGASLDRKSTTGGCQFLGCRLISWQCKKQTVVANSTTEAEYVAASSCCGQLQALVDGKKIIVTEASVRRNLQLDDKEGTDCLPNATIFEELTRMGMVKNLDNAGKFLMYP